LSVPAGVHLHSVGWKYSLNYNAGGNCIEITGDDAKISDLKIVITAGAGGAGTRPNCVYATGRTNLEVRSCWLVGDTTVGDDGSDLRQCGIIFDDVTYSRIHDCRTESNKRHGIVSSGSLSSNITVCGNRCHGNLRAGILMIATLGSNIVLGNNCYSNTGEGIWLAVTPSNIVSGNTCNNNINGINLYGSVDNTVCANTCNSNGQNGILIGTYSNSNNVSSNTCKTNDVWGIMVDDNSDYNKVHGNYTSGNTSGSIRINSVDCDQNQIEWNTVEEGAPSDAGTNTRSYGNYDPSANAFVGDVGAAPF
jgi:parallel beta-helix repeat protein